MSGAHHATIGKLVSRVRELENENAFLDGQADELRAELADAESPAGDESARAIFHFLRRELASWPRSDWRELGRLIALHVDGL